MKRRISSLLTLTLVLSLLPLTLTADAATITYNNDGIYQKQKTNYTCTLASAVMMLRRRAIMNGATDWEKITESNVRGTAWMENEGLRHSFSYAGMDVRCEALSGSSAAAKKAELISLLDKNPSGIVIYNGSIPHAVFLTDYNPVTDTFLCMDPSGTVKSGRIALAKSSLGSAQDRIIAALDCYWYVKSCDYIVGVYTVSNSGKGVYLRSTADSSYQKLDQVPDGTEVMVTAVCGKLGQTTYGGKSGWVALSACEYKTKAYHVIYLKNGGSGTQMENSVFAYGVKNYLPDCTYTNGSLDFLGWYLYRPRAHTWLYSDGTASQWCIEGQEPAGYVKKLMTPGSALLKGDTRYGTQVYAYAQWGVSPADIPQPAPFQPPATEPDPPVTDPDVPDEEPDIPDDGTASEGPDPGGEDRGDSGTENPADETPGSGKPSMEHFTRKVPYAPGQYSDVNENSWYGSNRQGSVMTACQLGLLQGTGGDRFSPEAQVSIAQVVTMATRLHCIYYNGSENFVQQPGDWFAVYRDYALENDIVPASFLADSQWARSTQATRAQCAYILSRALPLQELPQRNDWPMGSIPDVNSSSAYSAEIYHLYRAGILSGRDGSGTFTPDSTIQRCEIAAIVARMAIPDLRL